MNVQEQVNQILKDNELDFTILKLPTQAILGEGEDQKIIPSPYFNLYNDKSGNIIHTVKAGYHISQNSEIVEAVVRGMKGFGELSVGKAMSINDGRRLIIQLAIDGEDKFSVSTMRKYVTIVDSNDGSTGLSVGIGNLDLFCQNQFYKFYKAGNFKFRHTASLEQRIKELPRLITLALGENMKLMDLFKSFESTKCSRDLAHKMVNTLLGHDRQTITDSEMKALKPRSVNVLNTLYDNINTEMNAKGDNLWGLFSGVTRWTTHHKSAPRRENGRIESLVTGTNYRTNEVAFDFAMERANLTW